jgi:hypothetical protein
MTRRLIALLAIASGVYGAPVIREIEPRGVQRGKTVQVLFKGTGLEPGSRIETTLPGGVSRLAPRADLMRPGTELPFLVEVKADAAPGLYPLRLVTSDGLSNVVLLAVSDLAESEEAESLAPKQRNDELKAAQSLATPGVVSGTLTEGDLDFYSVSVKANQRLVFDVDARSMASAVDPAIELLDASGKVLARNEDAFAGSIDARLDHTFAKPGTYYVRVHDSKYSDQAPNHFYRLKVGAWEYADALFPLGWRRGESVSVQASGGSLQQPVTLKPETNSTRKYVPVSLAKSQSLPQLFVLSDKAEVLEPAETDKRLPAETVVNGRIAAKGEVDRYRLAVKPGEDWTFEVTASALGTSRLDALLTVSDAAGKKLASRDDLAGADPVLPVTIPEGVQEVTVAIEDLLGRGGPGYGYRLMARREPADFTVRLATPFVNVPAGGTALVQADVQRRGYDGPVRVMVRNLPKGFRQAGGYIAPSAAQQRFDDPNPRFNSVRTTLSITADADASTDPVNLELVASADTGKGRVTRTAEGPGLVVGVKGLRQKTVTAAWLEMGLPMAPARPVPVRITSPVPLVRISQGVEYPIQFRVERAPNARLVRTVRENVASAVGNLRILQGEKGKSPDQVTMLVNTNFATPATLFDFYATGTFDVDGATVDVVSPVVTFEIAYGYQLKVKQKEWTGTEIAGEVYREPTFEGGLVRIGAQDLPDGVTCPEVEVPADSREFRLLCTVAATAPRGKHPIRLVSSAPDTGKSAKDTYKGPEVTVDLRIP